MVLQPDGEERKYRDLWRLFYHTVSIEERYNPKCRMTHMPKRYWNNMTEFQHDEKTPIPETERLGMDVYKGLQEI